MLILDGKKIRDEIAEKLKSKISSASLRPALVIIQVGENKESDSYIRQKVLFGEKSRIRVIHKKFLISVTQVELLREIQKLNIDKEVHGIIVQLPLPQHLNGQGLIDSIASLKDVDGMNAENTVRFWRGEKGIVPATTRGILTLVDYYKIPVKSKKVVVIGKSLLVGKPIALAFMNRNATVTICHKHTENLKEHTQSADIIIVAAGAPKLITKDHIHSSGKQVIIDVGITSLLEDGIKKLVGDVDFNAVAPHVAMITPVPGGVGPLTVASLFQNLCDSLED